MSLPSRSRVPCTLAAPILAACIAFAPIALAQPQVDEPSAKELARVAGGLSSSLVIVEITLQFDKGEAPETIWQPWMRAASDAEPSAHDDWGQLLDQQRPAERSGFLIAPDRVLTTDPLLHPRFIKSIAVRAGGKLYAATPDGYARTQNAMYLKLSEPIAAAKPLTFVDRPGPLLGVAFAQRDGQWVIGASGMPTRATFAGFDRQYSRVSAPLLVTDAAGAAVGLTLTGDLDLDGKWKGSPDAWPRLDPTAYDAALARLQAIADRSLLRVSLALRSPKSDSAAGGGRFRSFGGMQGESQEATEWHGTGILIDRSTVLVLAALKPKVTSRLETITIHVPGGSDVVATFDGALADFNAFLAALPAPLEGVAKPWTNPITDLRHQLLLTAEITVHGETRTAYYSRARASDFSVGFRRIVQPQISASAGGGRSYNPYGGDSTPSLRFAFTIDGELVAIPISRRPKVSEGDQSDYLSYRYGGGQLMPIAAVLDALKDRKAAIDPENRPLSEAQESRLAWLGVEMQPMDPDLARVNGVSDQTAGGATGALVSFIYPDSPAAKAGLQVGDIILRLHVEGQPRPLEVALDPDQSGGMFDQLWQMMDQIPEEYFDEMPKPWGSVENAVTRALTDVGFGTAFRAEVFREGSVRDIPMSVAEGPAHFASASKHKSEPAGLTVRELTYEVRRYFQMTPDQPGLIISKSERGGKASIAGLKPYEVITQIGDTPMNAIADFESALKAGGELRLSIKRMTEGRIVKLRIDAPTP